MQIVILLLAIATIVALVAWVGGSLAPAQRSGRSRPNVLFWLVGACVMGGGLILAIVGAGEVTRASGRPDQFDVTGAEATADAVSIVVWGVVVLTIGAYVWRGARRRGARDRFGRLVIIVGYLLLAVAMTEAVHRAVDIWAVAPDQAQDVLNDTMVVFLLWGLPASALVWVGAKVTPERILLTASMRADY